MQFHSLSRDAEINAMQRNASVRLKSTPVPPKYIVVPHSRNGVELLEQDVPGASGTYVQKGAGTVSVPRIQMPPIIDEYTIPRRRAFFVDDPNWGIWQEERA